MKASSDKVDTTSHGPALARIDYFFDFLSPYSYLSWIWLQRNAAECSKWGAEIEYRPVPLAQIIKSYETKGPAEIAPKRDYLFKECLRYSAVHDIPFKTPSRLPFNSLYALRMALSANAGADQVKVIDTLFKAAWQRGLDLGEPQVLIDVLKEENLSQDIFERAGQKDYRKMLKQNIKDALAENIFGVPTFVVTKENAEKELFWGNESLPWLKLAMQGKDPMDPEEFENFKHTVAENIGALDEN